MDMMAALNDGHGLEEVDTISQWSDGGPHFRCNRSLATISSIGCERLLLAHGPIRTRKEKTLYTVDLPFGVPAHFKNNVDGDFSYVRSLVAEAARDKPVLTIADVVESCRRLDAENISRRGLGARDYVFIEYFPPWSKDSMIKWSRKFTPQSFKVGIRSCQAFQAKTNDCRRVGTLFGTGVRANTLTAIDFRSSMLHDNKVGSEYKCLPEVVPPTDLDPECEMIDAPEVVEEHLKAEVYELFDGAAPGDLAANMRAQMGEKIIDGWHTSYRTSHPEDMHPASWSKRLLAQKNKFQAARVPLLAASIKTNEQRLADQKKWAASKSSRLKAASAAKATSSGA
jgi:hypothetical protein